jgi:hypothetical protein
VRAAERFLDALPKIHVHRRRRRGRAEGGRVRPNLRAMPHSHQRASGQPSGEPSGERTAASGQRSAEAVSDGNEP